MGGRAFRGVVGYRMTAKTSTRETQFLLAFKHEVVILVKVGMESHRTKYYNKSINREQTLDLDLLNEKREAARGQTTIYKQKMAKLYNKNVQLQ